MKVKINWISKENKTVKPSRYSGLVFLVVLGVIGFGAAQIGFLVNGDYEKKVEVSKSEDSVTNTIAQRSVTGSLEEAEVIAQAPVPTPTAPSATPPSVTSGGSFGVSPVGCSATPIRAKALCVNDDVNGSVRRGIPKGVTAYKDSLIELVTVTDPGRLKAGIFKPSTGEIGNNPTKAIFRPHGARQSDTNLAVHDAEHLNNPRLFKHLTRNEAPNSTVIDDMVYGADRGSYSKAYKIGGTATNAVFSGSLDGKGGAINPDFANDSGEYLASLLKSSNSGSNTKDVISEDETCEMINLDEIHIFSEEISECYTGCVEQRSPVTQVFTKAFADFNHWLKCLYDDEDCGTSTILAIKVEPDLGSSLGCYDGNCGVTYSDHLRAAMKPPGNDVIFNEKYGKAAEDIIKEQDAWAGEPPLLVGTICEVSVDGGAPQPVVCVHDVSYMRSTYDEQIAGREPHSSKATVGMQLYDSFDEYWDGVIEYAENHNQSCPGVVAF